MILTIKQARKISGMTKEEVADYIGISKIKYSRIENGSSKPDEYEKETIADAFNLNLFDLWFE